MALTSSRKNEMTLELNAAAHDEAAIPAFIRNFFDVNFPGGSEVISITQINQAMHIVLQKIMHYAAPTAPNLKIRIKARLLFFQVSFQVFDCGDYFDPARPPFFNRLTDAEYWLVKNIFNHITYSRHAHTNCTELFIKL